MSFTSKDSEVQKHQLRVQELVVQLASATTVQPEAVGFASIDTGVLDLNVGEPVSKVLAVLHVDDSVPAAILAEPQSAIDLATANHIKITMTAPGTSDTFIVKYILAE
jgi:hypothetical protein